MKQCLPLLLLFCSATSAASKPHKGSAPTRSAKPKFSVQALVKKTMDGVLKNEGSGTGVDFEEHNEAALPFLEPYSHSDNTDFRFVVEEAASREHSALALHLLSNILVRPDEDSNVADHTMDSIAGGFSRTELRSWGGEALRQRLIQKAKRDQYFPKAIISLSAFPDAPTRKFLTQLGTIPYAEGFKFDLDSPEVKRSFVTDIALAEMGDEAGLRRLTRTIEGKSIPERVWLCYALPLLQKRRVLQLIPPFLNDTRIAKERTRTIRLEREDGEFEQKEVKLPPFRVCDVAARAITFRVNEDSPYYGYLYDGPPLVASDLAKVRAMRF